MLSEATKQEIRNKLDLIKRSMPHFRSRPGQRVMIAEVAKALAGCPHPVSDGAATDRPNPGASVVCINGGTGIGKSLGYSLPGIILAQLRKKKLVISSSTVALQEQLVFRDLPQFLKAAQISAKVEIAKGRTRYVCAYRLLQTTSGKGDTLLHDGHLSTAPGHSPGAAAATITAMVERYNAGAWDGDRDAWHTSIDDTVWNSVTTDRHGCLGQQCPSLRFCAQAAARKRISTADVIVANHDLVLADLAMGGKLIAKPEDCLYVFDEAHHLPKRAVSAFATSHRVRSGRRLMVTLRELVASTSEVLGLSYQGTAQATVSIIDRLDDGLKEIADFFGSLARLRPTESTPRPTLEFKLSCIPEEFRSIGTNIIAATSDLIEHLHALTELLIHIPGDSKVPQVAIDRMLASTGFLLGRLEEIRRTWEMFLDEPALDQPPIAKWVEAIQGRNTVDFRMCASPVLASNYLRTLLWEKAAGVVLASATMTCLGTFDEFLYTTGLDAYGASVVCVELPSPFCYRDQGTLEIPAMKSSPKDYNGHTTEITQFLERFVSDATPAGTLVLFTSRRQMCDVADRLPSALRAQILIQGQQSKVEIIREHKVRIDRGEPSTIFGLASFSEGVDLVGEYCTHVVVSKLPFAVPTDPVVRTLSDWITRRGGHAFMEIYVPDAARKLEQSVGRLIRTESDHGHVTVLDPRLWDATFGRAILRGLPPFRLVVRGKEHSL